MNSFKDEYDYLIHLIRCAIHNENPQELPKDFSFEKVFKYAVDDDVANIAFESIEKLINKPEKNLYNKWSVKRDLSITKYINQCYARQEILNAFQSAGIRSVEVQGTQIRALYPKPEYRTMSDIDFIIDLSNLSKANDILISLGYDCKNKDGVEVDGIREPNIAVEIHTVFFDKNSQFYGYLGDPFDCVTKTDGLSCSVSEDIFYLYSMMHIAKHYFGRGCGMRRVLDVYFFNVHYNGIKDRPFISQTLENAEIKEFAEDISSLADAWFGNGVCSKKLSIMADSIKNAGGVHGSWQMFASNNLHKEMLKNNDNQRFIKLRYVISRLFADKNTMIKSYPILEKHVILMPVCWIHRLGCVILKRSNKLVDEIKGIIKTDLKQF